MKVEQFEDIKRKRDELIDIQGFIQGTKYDNFNQSIDLLIEHGFILNQHIARTGQLMSECKKILHDARKKAYEAARETLQAKDRKYSPLLLKDYINDCCAVENELYELAERTNKACTHSHGLIITAVSALKAERFSSQFNN
jgi:hypothetical protein